MTEINPNMSLDDAVPGESNYLKKEDVGEKGVNLKIASLSRKDMDDTSRKTVIYWTDSSYKGMVLNVTNKNRLNMILQADTVGELIGRTVNVYNDPLVEYAGKITGGLRIRASVNATTDGTDPAGGTMPRDEALKKHAHALLSNDAKPGFTDDIPF